MRARYAGRNPRRSEADLNAGNAHQFESCLRRGYSQTRRTGCGESGPATCAITHAVCFVQEFSERSQDPSKRATWRFHMAERPPPPRFTHKRQRRNPETAERVKCRKHKKTRRSADSSRKDTQAPLRAAERSPPLHCATGLPRTAALRGHKASALAMQQSAHCRCIA